MSENKEWLVKSSGEVRGPYSFDEVVEQIQSKEIILVDEVARSFGRWRYVRDEGVFESVVLEQRNKEESKSEKTYTSSSTDAITQEISDGVVSFSKTQKIQEPIKEFLNQQNEKRKTHAKETDSASSYVFENDRAVRAGLERLQIFKMLGVLLVLGAILYGYRTYNGTVHLTYDEQKTLAKKQFELGQFEKAQKSFEAIVSSNQQDDELQYLYALNAFYMGDSLVSEKVLESLKNKNTKYSQQVYNLLGINQLKNYNLTEAREYFENSTKLAPQFVPGYYNKGIVDFLENKFLDAHANFKKALDLGGQDAAILLMNAEFLLSHSHLVMSKEQITSEVLFLKKMIDEHVRKYLIYRQELLIAYAALESLSIDTDIGGSARVIGLLSRAVNEEPDLTQDHIFDMSFYRDVVTWNRIHSWIKQMKSVLPNNDDLSSLYGLSLFKGTEKIEGKSYIEGRLDPGFLHPIDHILHVYVLSNLGRDADAEVALMSIPNEKWTYFANNLKAKICLRKKDIECAKSYFNKSYQMNKENPVALLGLAFAHRAMGATELENTYLSQALKLSPYYKPGLSLKYEKEFSGE